MSSSQEVSRVGTRNKAVVPAAMFLISSLLFIKILKFMMLTIIFILLFLKEIYPVTGISDPDN